MARKQRKPKKSLSWFDSVEILHIVAFSLGVMFVVAMFGYVIFFL